MNQPAPLPLRTSFDEFTQPERVAYLRAVMSQYNLTVKDLSQHTGYAESSVQGWFSPPESARYRLVPSRAVRLLAAEVSSGAVIRR